MNNQLCNTCNDIITNNNIRCNNNCYYCIDCFKNYINTLNDEISLNYYKEHNLVKCAYCDYNIEEEQIYSKYIKCYISKIISFEQQITEKNTIERLNNLTDNHINKVKTLLTTCISCPHCNQPFFDFSGCMALLCLNCNNKFCCICLEKHTPPTILPREEITHYYVRTHNKEFTEERKQYYEINDVFISTEGWEKYKEYIKKTLIIKYFLSIDEDIRNNILEILRRENLLKETTIMDINIFYKKRILINIINDVEYSTIDINIKKNFNFILEIINKINSSISLGNNITHNIIGLNNNITDEDKIKQEIILKKKSNNYKNNLLIEYYNKVQHLLFLIYYYILLIIDSNYNKEISLNKLKIRLSKLINIKYYNDMILQNMINNNFIKIINIYCYNGKIYKKNVHIGDNKEFKFIISSLNIFNDN